MSKRSQPSKARSADKEQEVYGNRDYFAGNMLAAVNDQAFSDFTFVVGDEKEKIAAHRVVLAARCQVFRAMFAEAAGTEDAHTLRITDIRPPVFLCLLEFIYTNRCVLTPLLAIEVLSAAVEYDLADLAECCSSFISANLSMVTVCPALHTAVTNSQHTLASNCLRFIEENTPVVLTSPNFVELSADSLVKILQSDKLQAKEMDILNAVLEWGRVNSTVTGDPVDVVLKDVIQHVRLPLLTEEELQHVEDRNDRDKAIPMSMIAKAWKSRVIKKRDPTDPQTRPRRGTVNV